MHESYSASRDEDIAIIDRFTEEDFPEAFSHLSPEEQKATLEKVQLATRGLLHAFEKLGRSKVMPDAYTREGFWEGKGYRQLLSSFNREEDEPQWHIVFADIVGLGSYNNTYGHEEGDELLRTFGAIIGEELRVDDILVRWGGDETAWFIRSDREGAEEVRSRVEERLKTSPVPINMSAGIAPLETASEEAIQTAIREADPKGKQ